MASCLFYQELIKECQQIYYCKDDRDFPEIILINYPFSLMVSLDEIKTNKNSLIQELQSCFDRLIKWDCEIIAIACNTLHVLMDKISIPKNICVRIDDSVFHEIKKQSLSQVLIFATETTTSLGLYKDTLAICSPLKAADQLLVSKIIDRILAGDMGEKIVNEFGEIIKKLHRDQAFDGIVLGCTEFSLLYEALELWMKKEVPNVGILDSTRLLVKEVVRKCFNI